MTLLEWYNVENRNQNFRKQLPGNGSIFLETNIQPIEFFELFEFHRNHEMCDRLMKTTNANMTSCHAHCRAFPETAAMKYSEVRQVLQI